ncbi:MAG TPA: oligopeptide ABC transporter permease [Bacillota bacterium]
MAVPHPEPVDVTLQQGLTRETQSWGRLFWHRFRRHKLAQAGLLVLLLIALGSIFAPQLSPYDPASTDLVNRLSPPSSEHWLGTDRYGRDVYTRLLYGGRVSLAVGVSAMAISVVLGTLIGAVAGFFGGAVDNLLMRLVDVVISLPGLMFLILVVSLFGRGPVNLVLVLGFLSWPGVARLVRGEILSLRQREFVEAARAVGAGSWALIFRHLLPNAMAPIIVATTLGVATVILIEAGLGYLGLGVPPPLPSWGNMIFEGQQLLRQAWWLLVFPGAAIFLTVLCFNLVGDALRDALDPRLKS